MGSVTITKSDAPLMDPEDALDEIELYFNMMGITEEEWGHRFYSQYMLVFQGIRNVVKATGRLNLKQGNNMTITKDYSLYPQLPGENPVKHGETQLRPEPRERKASPSVDI